MIAFGLFGTLISCKSIPQELKARLFNSLIKNHDNDRPVAVIGMDNVVVINTKGGVLVARKDLSQKVGEIRKRING